MHITKYLTSRQAIALENTPTYDDEVPHVERSRSKRILNNTLACLSWKPQLWRKLAWATLLFNYLTCFTSVLTRDAFILALREQSSRSAIHQIYADVMEGFPLHTLAIALAFGSLFLGDRAEGVERGEKKRQRLAIPRMHSDTWIQVYRAISTLLCISIALFSVARYVLTPDPSSPRITLQTLGQTTLRPLLDRDPLSFWILLSGFMVDWYTCFSQLREKNDLAASEAGRQRAERSLEEGKSSCSSFTEADIEIFHDLDSEVATNKMEAALFKMWPVQCLAALMLAIPSLKFTGYSDSFVHTHMLVQYFHVGYGVCLVLSYICSIGYMSMHAMDEKLKDLGLPRLTSRERRLFSPLFFTQCQCLLFIAEGCLLLAIRYNCPYLPHVPAIPSMLTPLSMVVGGLVSMITLGAAFGFGVQCYAKQRGVSLET